MAKACKLDMAAAFIGTTVQMVPEARAATSVAMGGGAWGTGPGDHSSRKRERPSEGKTPGFLPAGYRVRPDASSIGAAEPLKGFNASSREEDERSESTTLILPVSVCCADCSVRK